MKKKYDLKTKGSLKLEEQTIKILIIIVVSSFILGLILQYISPMFFSEIILDKIHYEFIINVLLGISCSACISSICIWVPYRSNKENQHRKLIKSIKNIYFDYYDLLSIIEHNKMRNNNDTYMCEYSLLKAAKKLEQDSYNLILEYEDSDIVSKNIDEIKKSTVEVFIPSTQIVESFINLIMPLEYKKNPDDLLFIEKIEDFDQDKNVQLYDQLKLSLDEILSAKKVDTLFSDYINRNCIKYEIVHHKTKTFLEKTQECVVQEKIHNIENKMRLNIINIMKKFNDKHLEEKLSEIMQKYGNKNDNTGL